MKQDQLDKKAAEILKSNIYFTLATTDGNVPWAAPLFYCMDEDFNFYFISQMESLHTIHIMKQPHVSYAVFDSHQREGEGNGIQGDGKVTLLEGDEITKGLKYYKTSFIKLDVEALSAPAPYRLFKITTNHFYILDPETETDKRIEVFLK
ncbi:MAG: pyridoxamine 5'-phosphate oxidase family protein [bacterium]|nr:pyridoxamine 5'-phosphate oxidase family protein [bacterium]